MLRYRTWHHLHPVGATLSEPRLGAGEPLSHFGGGGSISDPISLHIVTTWELQGTWEVKTELIWELLHLSLNKLPSKPTGVAQWLSASLKTKGS